jgi:hypothetical protein
VTRMGSSAASGKKRQPTTLPYTSGDVQSPRMPRWAPQLVAIARNG